MRRNCSSSTLPDLGFWDNRSLSIVGLNAQIGEQVGTLQGHTGSVESIAFSPDGRYIASGSADKTVRVWNAQTGAQMGKPLQGHTDWVCSVAFSSDGKHIVSGSGDHTICVWDVHTGTQVGKPLQGHTNAVRSAAFSLDGRHIVSGSWDQTIRVWDAQTGAQVAYPFQEHTNSVNSVPFSPDGRHIASGSDGETIQVWNEQAHDQIGGTGKNIISSIPINFSPSRTHALQHPQSLFNDLLSDVNGDILPCVKIQEDGWIVAPSGKLLLWVPPSYRPIFLYSSHTNMVIPRSTELDLSKMKHGSAWQECYSSHSIATSQ